MRTIHRTRLRWQQKLGVLLLILALVFPFAPALTPQPILAQPPAPTPFQIGEVSDETMPYLTFRYEIPDPDGVGGRPPVTPIPGMMTANFSDIVVIPGGGVIGGDALEFDVTITNNSPLGSGVILTAFAFQSKFSESPALGSRIGDKAFYGQLVGGGVEGQMYSVKKNGTSNGLYTGKWKGICINSSLDFISEFNSGLDNESLECAGNRVDTNEDGEPEIQTGANMLGLRPGESQTVRVRIEAGTTDGALHVVQEGTLTGTVRGVEQVGPNGVTYYDVEMDTPGTVLDVVEWGDNKVLRDADGTFNPTFAPASDGLSFAGQQYLTLPRPNFTFSDIIGRNHTCETYGLTLGACAGNPTGQPYLDFLATGDLVPGVQNFAAILRGFGEFYDPNGDFVPDENPVFPGDTRPNYPYDTLCLNCGGVPYTPIAEFYLDNGDGTVTRQMVAGNYGDPVAQPYLATINSLAPAAITQETIPELDPGGPCIGGGRRPACAQLGGRATGVFHSLAVVPGQGINGGDAIEFTIDITNNSTNPDTFLTAFNYQTKRRGLADIGVLDGFTQDRRDVRTYDQLPMCNGLNDDSGCYNASLGIGQFPNVIGNGLLFGQMVWTDANAGREPDPVDSDQVFVNTTGINPALYRLESVKKNGPFAPILKGNTNFICVKSGLFLLDPDSDAACAGEPATLIDPEGDPIPSNIDTSDPLNPTGRLGLRPGETQPVRIRMEFGDFRGALLEVVAGLLTTNNVDPRYASTQGLARFFDCSDQRELEFCHPNLVGTTIGYLPNTNGNPAAATWLTPATLEDIRYVIINQPGDAPTVMDFAENLGYILAMAGFVPSAEFYAPDPNEDLIGTPYEGVLIRQQVLGEYSMTAVPATPVNITSIPATVAALGQLYTYDVNATAFPGPINYSLFSAPAGMSINSSTGLINWTPAAAGTYEVGVMASNSIGSDTQMFQIVIDQTLLDAFNRANGRLGASWAGPGLKDGYRIHNQQVRVNASGGAVFWKSAMGADQEVFVTMTEIDSNGDYHCLVLKAQQTQETAAAITVSYRVKEKKIVVEAKEPKKNARVIATISNVTLRNGDRVGARAWADGTVQVLVNGQVIGQATAPAYFVNRGGHVGVWYFNTPYAKFDDFGGGAIGGVRSAAVDDVSMIEDFDGFEHWFETDVEVDPSLFTNRIFLPTVNR